MQSDVLNMVSADRMNIHVPTEQFNVNSESSIQDSFGNMLQKFVEQSSNETANSVTPSMEQLNIEKNALLPSPWVKRNSVDEISTARSQDKVTVEDSIQNLERVFKHAQTISVGSQVISATTSSVRQLVRQS